MLIYWKAIQFGILEALSYGTIKKKRTFQTYFLVLGWCCYYVLGWLSSTMKFKNGAAVKCCIYPVLKEWLGYEYTIYEIWMQIFDLPTSKITSKARIWLPREHFQTGGFFGVFSVTNYTCKKSVSCDNSQDFQRNKSDLGSERTADPDSIMIALMFCLIPAHQTLPWASWNYRKINKWWKQTWDWVDSLPGLPVGAAATPSEAPWKLPNNKKSLIVPIRKAPLLPTEKQKVPPSHSQTEPKKSRCRRDTERDAFGRAGTELRTPFPFPQPFSILWNEYKLEFGDWRCRNDHAQVLTHLHCRVKMPDGPSTNEVPTLKL